MKKYILALFFIAMLFGCVSAPLQPPPLQQPVYNKDLNVVTYMGITYYYDRYITGIAGYKTIDKIAKIKKTIFISITGSKINMIQIISQKKEPVFVGFDVVIRYAIEDTDCNGIFETVKAHNEAVYPPDCFYMEPL